MVILPPSRSVNGFTLIEVLIALAIMAIAMTAVIKAASQNIRGTGYLENKTIAFWVAENWLNEVRVGLIKLPGEEGIKNQTEMLDRDWYGEIKSLATPNQHIKKIRVCVSPHPLQEGEVCMVSGESYVYHP